MITVFTPVYNRAHTLERLYISLEKQTCRDFEWIVVDDGSTDGSFDQLLEMQSKASFHIELSQQKNAGKHAAINRGVKLAAGELFFIVDSDDYLRENAVETIIRLINNLPKNERFAGISGIRVNPNGELIGTTFSETHIDCTALEREKYHVTGDKSEVYFTNILRKYPFPVFQGENFLTECVVWYRIANDGYKIRWTNEPIYVCEYQSDGLSHTTGKCSRNFEGYMLHVKELLGYNQLSIKRRLKNLAMFSAIAYKEKKDLRSCAAYIERAYLLVVILGWFGFQVYKLKSVMVRGRNKNGQ